LGPEKKLRPFASQVREVFVIHVGGTRCITSSTDHMMKILARITLTVEVIRCCLFIFVVVCLNTITSRIKTNATFFDVLELVSNSAGAKGSKKLSASSVPSMMMQRRFHLPFYTVREICLYYTCWWYSLCNFQYRQHYENTCSDHFEC
jgi:hypothetical protein